MAGVTGDKITVRSFDVSLPLARIRGDGDYVPSTDKGEVRATVDLPSLEPLSAMAGRALMGKAQVQVNAGIDKGNLTASWQGRADDFGTPDVPSGLVAALSLAGNATLTADGAWTMRDVRLGSDSGTLTVSGRGREQAGTLDLVLDLPRLAAFRADVGGAATVNATVGFGGPETSLKLKAETRDVTYRAPGQAIASRRLVLDTTVSLSADGKLGGTVQAEGDVQNQPLTLNGRFAHDATAGLSVPSFQGRWSSAVLDIANLVVSSARTTGHARLTVSQLRDIEALKTFGLEGSLVADVTADPSAPAGRLDIFVKRQRPGGPGRRRGHTRSLGPCRRSCRPRRRRPDAGRDPAARRRRSFGTEGDRKGRSPERHRRHAAGLGGGALGRSRGEDSNSRRRKSASACRSSPVAI